MSTPETPDSLPNPFSNARLIGTSVSPLDYHKTTVPRGDPAFVMTRSNLQMVHGCARKWIEGAEDADTKATIWGSLADCLDLPCGHFEKLFAVYPLMYPCEPTNKDPRTERNWSGNATYCREWKAEQVGAGKTCIYQKKLNRDGSENEETEAVTLDRAKAAHDRLYADPIIKELLECSQYQVAVHADYNDHETGLVIPCKTLVDIWPDKDHPVYGCSQGDLKTSISIAPRKWEQKCEDMGYDVQAAQNLYFAQALGEDRFEFYHVVQESSEPFLTGRRLFPSEWIRDGQAKLWDALKWYCQCLSKNYWPDYDQAAPAGALVMHGWQVMQRPQYAALRRDMSVPEFPNMESEEKPTGQNEDIIP